MIDKRNVMAIWAVFLPTAFLLITSHPLFVFAANEKQPGSACIDRAIHRIQVIRSLPEKQFLHTLDGKDVALQAFYHQCKAMFPWCSFFHRFYYWKHETKLITSLTQDGQTTHTIRCYYNTLSTCCPHIHDPLKTHGDVAEYYDEKGQFMGLAVYMGNGEYCALPYHGYQTRVPER